MSTFSISIDTGNAAFDEDNHGPELARILHALADELAELGDLPSYHAALHDYNGNRCGIAVFAQTDFDTISRT